MKISQGETVHSHSRQIIAQVNDFTANCLCFKMYFILLKQCIFSCEDALRPKKMWKLDIRIEETFQAFFLKPRIWTKTFHFIIK